jgi:hypothetical protein
MNADEGKSRTKQKIDEEGRNAGEKPRLSSPAFLPSSFLTVF